MATRSETNGTSDAIDRRGFLGSMAALGAPLAMAGAPLETSLRGPRVDGGCRRAGGQARELSDFPRNDLERVHAVVAASHGDLDTVRGLVTEQPALAKASWDWGFGDWETALGAAAHTGRRDIAELLIAHGARPTIFSAAMLGQLDTVRAFLGADPGLFRLHGPHGISLLRHALAGGDRAEPVADHLRERFGPDEQPRGFPGDDATEALYGGRYRIDSDPPFELAVAVRNGWLAVGAGEPISRVLQIGEHVFHPTGAPAVRIRFEVVDGRARRVTIEDGPVAAGGDRTAM